MKRLKDFLTSIISPLSHCVSEHSGTVGHCSYQPVQVLGVSRCLYSNDVGFSRSNKFKLAVHVDVKALRRDAAPLVSLQASAHTLRNGQCLIVSFQLSFELNFAGTFVSNIFDQSMVARFKPRQTAHVHMNFVVDPVSSCFKHKTVNPLTSQYLLLPCISVQFYHTWANIRQVMERRTHPKGSSRMHGMNPYRKPRL